MLMPIDFNDEKGAAAFEIDDVRRKGRLATKVMTDGPKLAQTKPQLHLIASHRFAQFSRTRICHSRTPPGACGATLPFGEGQSKLHRLRF